MNILAHDYRSFRENKNTIFSLIEQTTMPDGKTPGVKLQVLSA